jgi:hypothetical protein
MTAVDRFERLFIPEPMSGCWLWTGAIFNTYVKKTTGCKSSWRGAFKLEGKREDASRASWYLYRGAIPLGLSVCHLCDNSLCVNPEHLYAATHFQNMQDAQKRGRMLQGPRKACPHGHPYTEENTRWRMTHGRRIAACRTCDRIQYEAYIKTDAYRSKLDRRIEKHRLQRTA